MREREREREREWAPRRQRGGGKSKDYYEIFLAIILNMIRKVQSYGLFRYFGSKYAIIALLIGSWNW